MKTKTVAIDEDVQDVLNRSTVLGNNLKLPDEQLDRALFEKVNKALTAIGGKWSRKFRCHVFPFDPSEFITKGVETGSVVNRQQTLQFFQTPVELAERMVRLVCADCLDTVLEPSAGHGRIVDALVRTGARVQAYEIDPTNANIVREKYSHVFVSVMDFLKVNPEPIYDAVVMNPPFTRGQDMFHIRHAFNFLKPGGDLVALCSPGPWSSSTSASRSFVEWLDSIGAEVEDVPEGTFKESGTGIRTKLITATR